MVGIVEIVALGFIIAWLGALTFFYFSLSTHYNSLTKGMSGKTLKSILEELLQHLKIAQKDIDALTVRCDTMEKDNLFHMQKIGLLRFNPFKDTGGDQSFILALLDGKDTGIVISSLYSRTGTRWYAKKIKSGKGVEHELSDEEKQVIKIAKPIE